MASALSLTRPRKSFCVINLSGSKLNVKLKMKSHVNGILNMIGTVNPCITLPY
jgi:hypothetical protein